MFGDMPRGRGAPSIFIIERPWQVSEQKLQSSLNSTVVGYVVERAAPVRARDEERERHRRTGRRGRSRPSQPTVKVPHKLPDGVLRPSNSHSRR